MHRYTWVALLGIGLAGVSCGDEAPETVVVVTGVTVDPPTATVRDGATVPFIATCEHSDGSTDECTDVVAWLSVDPTVAMVSNDHDTWGIATGVSRGTVTIRAMFAETEGTATLTVTEADVVQIAVTAEQTSIAAGFDVQCSATCSWSDGDSNDCTNEVTWSSDAGNVVVSNDGGTEGLASTLSPGTANITAQMGGQSDTVTLTVTAATLVSIEVTPEAVSVAAGYTTEFAATCTFSDASENPCTNNVVWASLDTSIAWVSTAVGTIGEATTFKPGAVQIVATLDGQSDSAVLTVTEAEVLTVTVSPADDADVPIGLTVTYAAMCSYSDGSQIPCSDDVTWDTGNHGIATVDDQGVVTGVAEGTTSVDATNASVPGSADVTVTAAVIANIEVTPANPSVVAGLDQQFAARCYWTDGSDEPCTTTVVWDSSDDSIALVSNSPGFEGLATSVKEGVTTISASEAGETGETGETELAVLPAELVNIVVMPEASEVPSGFFLQFTATGQFTDGSEEDISQLITWWSQNDEVATVENHPAQAGRALGVDPTATPNPVLVTATHTLTGISASAQLTVIDDELCSISASLGPPSIGGVIKVNDSAQASAIGTFCVAGTTTQSYATEITNHDDLIWSTTAAPQYGVISNDAGSKGWFQALQAFDGDFEIQASLSGFDGVTSVYIREPMIVHVRVDFDHGRIDAPVGLVFQASCFAVNEDLEEIDVTTDPNTVWDVSHPNVAHVDQEGVVTPLAALGGEDKTPVMIQCAYMPSLPECPPSGVCVAISGLWVHDCVVDSMAIEPADVTVANGSTQQLTASGDYVYAEGAPSAGLACVGIGESTFDVTAVATWESLDTGVAVLVDAVNDPGLVQVVIGDGSSATIQATLDTESAQATIHSSP
ncbi:Ig-like domain-containing protein [Myxococcota bacterium]